MFAIDLETQTHDDDDGLKRVQIFAPLKKQNTRSEQDLVSRPHFLTFHFPFFSDLSTLDLPTDLHNFDPAIFESLLSTKSGSQMDVEENVGAWLGSVYENNQTQSSSSGCSSSSGSSMMMTSSSSASNNQSNFKLNHELNGNNTNSGLIRGDPLMSFNSLNSDLDLS